MNVYDLIHQKVSELDKLLARHNGAPVSFSLEKPPSSAPYIATVHAVCADTYKRSIGYINADTDITELIHRLHKKVQEEAIPSRWF